MKYAQRIVFLFFIILLFQSCCTKHDEARYEYGGIKIKRIDVCGKTTFYYEKNGQDYGKIWAEYSGINDGFYGYLVFEKDGKVTIFVSDGYFQKKVADKFKFSFLYYMDSAYMANNYWNITHNLQFQKSIYIISYPMEHEIDKNAKIKTKVKATYE